METNVLAYCEAYPTISTRELAREVNTSRVYKTHLKKT